MRRMLLIESGARGVLAVNGVFCGPVEPCGQAFPCGGDAEVYIQLFPFEPGQAPLTAALVLRGGEVERLTPEGCCYMLLWPDGVMELELRMPGQEDAPDGAREDAQDVLTAYLNMRRTGDARSRELLAGPGAEIALGEYDAVVPLRFMPVGAPRGFDLRAGIVRRVSGNVAKVDAVLARTAVDAAGRQRILGMAVLEG